MEGHLSSSGGHLGERVHALIDRELSAEDEATVRDHLASCSACAEEHRKISGAVMAVGALGRVRAPEGFATRLLKRARAARRAGGLRSLAEHKVPYEGAIVVLLAAAIAALLLTFGAHANWNVVARNLTGTEQPRR